MQVWALKLRVLSQHRVNRRGSAIRFIRLHYPIQVHGGIAVLSIDSRARQVVSLPRRNIVQDIMAAVVVMGFQVGHRAIEVRSQDSIGERGRGSAMTGYLDE